MAPQPPYLSLCLCIKKRQWFLTMLYIQSALSYKYVLFIICLPTSPSPHRQHSVPHPLHYHSLSLRHSARTETHICLCCFHSQTSRADMPADLKEEKTITTTEINWHSTFKAKNLYCILFYLTHLYLRPKTLYCMILYCRIELWWNSEEEEKKELPLWPLSLLRISPHFLFRRFSCPKFRASDRGLQFYSTHIWSCL